jgi:hypothetical protein
MQHSTAQHITDAMIHTGGVLSESEFKVLSDRVHRGEGIVSLSRNPHTPRFLIVVYNAARTSSIAILNRVRQQGYQASLIGI